MQVDLYNGRKAGGWLVWLIINYSVKALGMAHVNEGLHRFTCHPQIHPQVDLTISTITSWPHSFATLVLSDCRPCQ